MVSKKNQLTKTALEKEFKQQADLTDKKKRPESLKISTEKRIFFTEEPGKLKD